MRHRRMRPRRGATLIYFVIMLMVLFGMAAFAIDVGYSVMVAAQLQNTADSAALAGVSALLPLQLNAVGNSNVPGSAAQASFVAAARAKASQFAAYNRAAGVSVTIPANRQNVDIVVGYQANPGGSVGVSTSNFPNAVQVTVRRDANANGAVPLFFAPLLGTSSYSGTATAVAAFWPATVNGFTGVASSTAWGSLLPIAIDYNFWTTLMASGKSPDGQVHDSYTVTMPTSSVAPPNNVTSGADGVAELTDVYGDKTSPGNFGLVSIGPSASDEPTFENWITKGPSASDIQYLSSNNLFNPSVSNPKAWPGGPGLKSPEVSAMASVIGQPRVVPLYTSYSGNGNNTTYNIVGFAGVTIVQATGQGSNIQVTIQPSIVINPYATTTRTSGSGTGQVTSGSFVYNLSLTQ